MLQTPSGILAQRLALAIPLALLGGAYLSEYGFGLFPCEMCWWQRWPHFAAVPLALLSFWVAPKRVWVALAGLAILASGLIGGFHAGVEYDWWEGITGCAVTAVPVGGSALDAVMDAPMVRCDEAPWDLFGISLAGWNFLISTLSGVGIMALLTKDARNDAN
ncbi:disulfide bond formation protein B [Erythrobacter sp. W53]|uniref:disulfide bond formation protein B n=1 Tax=Erythrobacter sp. W53 TaxID=3425947 RepID=UPI003D76954F